MDARLPGRLDRFTGAVDIVEAGTGETADDRVFGALGDLIDGGEVAFGGDWKTCLDNIDTHLVEQFSDSSFSSCVMVAPGHCSPSRKVVSKMTTRSLSDLGGSVRVGSDGAGLDWAGVVMTGVPLACARPTSASAEGMGVGRSWGPWLGQPLSAQAQTPSRPSGATKKQEPTENEGGAGGGHFGRPGHRAQIAAAD